MNKNDLVNELSVRIGLQKNTTKEVVETLINVMKDAISDGDKIQLVGFGSFGVVNRKARVGQNPKTGSKIDIPAKKVVKFKASKKMNEFLN